MPRHRFPGPPVPPPRRPLLRWGEFTSHSDLQLSFKIECDALTNRDWDCVARMIAARWSFRAVEGVPTGGLKLADRLQPYVSAEGEWADGVYPLLVVDDVLTTGASMERHRAGRPRTLGVVLFARGYCPWWVLPIFQLMV